MLFDTKDYKVDFVQQEDLEDILGIYNSNIQFLRKHMELDMVTREWLLEEVMDMKKVGFNSCKIIEISSGKIIGIMDYKVGDETYLSLLMIHNDYRGKGIGNLIYQAFEEYLKSLNSKCIRIDVVTNYNNLVTEFWINKGFIKFNDIKLNWTGKILPAVTMKKYLNNY